LDDRRLLQNDLDDARDKIRDVKDIEAHLNSLDEENQRLRGEIDDYRRLRNELEEQELEIEQLRLEVREKDVAISRDRGSRKNTMAFDEEAKKSMNELMELYEEVQRENEILRNRLFDLNPTPDEAVSAAIESLQNENSKLVESVRHLEDYVSELTDLFKDSEKMRKELELEVSQNSRSNSRKNSTRYVSNDAELMEFIEQMNTKMDSMRYESEQLKRENDRLQSSAGKNILRELDSGKGTSIPATPVSNDRRGAERDLTEALEREERLENDFNGLLREFERMTVQIAELNMDNHRLTQLVQRFREDEKRLQEKLQDTMLDSIGGKDTSSRTYTKMQQFLAEIRLEYQSSLKRDAEQYHLIEEDLRDLRRERDLERYQKQHNGTQTNI
jgi:hypothetical protein